MTKGRDALHYAGERLTIWFVRLTDGSVPAEAFLASLGTRERAAFRALFEALGDKGTIRNIERFRLIVASNGVWEFKVSYGPGWRMWGKFGPDGMYVTHGAKKSSERRLKREVTRAQELYRQRRSAGHE